MKKISSPLFKGITDDEFKEMESASCLREKSFRKNEFIFRMGDKTSELGIVISGNVMIENTDILGNTGILTKIGQGGVFAETYALCKKPMMVEVIAYEASLILFFNVSALENKGSEKNSWQNKMLKNLLDMSAAKNITLSERMFCISPKTVRGRVLAFLSAQSSIHGSNTFEIPFNRQQMADYLNVERSALSKELGKMKDDKIIDFYKNSFTLKS